MLRSGLVMMYLQATKYKYSVSIDVDSCRWLTSTHMPWRACVAVHSYGSTSSVCRIAWQWGMLSCDAVYLRKPCQTISAEWSVRPMAIAQRSPHRPSCTRSAVTRSTRKYALRAAFDGRVNGYCLPDLYSVGWLSLNTDISDGTDWIEWRKSPVEPADRTDGWMVSRGIVHLQEPA